MPPPAWRPPPRPPSSYSIYPLKALDGVLAYVALNGETVAYCFGPDEPTVAQAVAEHMPELASRSQSQWASSEE
jgi:hypothetical protein